jgi:hypothetical protein
MRACACLWCLHWRGSSIKLSRSMSSPPGITTSTGYARQPITENMLMRLWMIMSDHTNHPPPAWMFTWLVLRMLVDGLVHVQAERDAPPRLQAGVRLFQKTSKSSLRLAVESWPEDLTELPCTLRAVWHHLRPPWYAVGYGHPPLVVDYSRHHVARCCGFCQGGRGASLETFIKPSS